jgi:hypothetical protein
VKLQQLEDRQVEAERTVEEHQIHVSVDTILQRFESVANADLNEVGQPRRSQVFSSTLRFLGLQFTPDQMAAATIASAQAR